MRRNVLWILLLAGLFLAGCRQGTVIAPEATVAPPLTRPALTPAASEIVRISVDELWQRIQGGEDTAIVDVRAKTDYEISHVPTAISIPEADFPGRAAELSKDRLLVFYCA